MRLQVEARDGVHTYLADERFVDDPEYGHEVAVLGLGDELREDADVIERALSICETHVAVEEVYGGEPW